MDQTQQIPESDFKCLFESAPGLFLALQTNFKILAVSDAYLKVARATRLDLLGKLVFDVFPYRLVDCGSVGETSLRASIERVLRYKEADAMAPLRSSPLSSNGETDSYEERHWSPCNSPVLDAEGGVKYIVHRIEDVTESVRLRQGEEILRLLISGVKDYAIVMLDKEGKISSWNSGAELITLYRADEVLGRPFSIFFTEEDRLARKPEAELQAARRQGRNEDEVWLVRKDGSKFWANAILTSLSEPFGGQLIGYSKVIQDLTERQRAEEIQRAQTVHEQSLIQFQDLANSIPQLAWIANEVGGVFWYNQRWYDYTGTNLEQMKGWGWGQVIHPNFLKDVVQRWKDHLCAGSSWEDTFPIRSRSGEWRWFLSRALPIRDSAGNIVRWFGTNTDVTDQREFLRDREKLLTDLEYEHARFEAVMQQMPAAVIVGEAPSGRLVFANKKMNEVWGHGLIPTQSVEEYSKWVGYHADGRPYLPEEWPIARAIFKGEVTENEDVVLHWPNGERRTIRLCASPVRASDGRILAGVVICQDITENQASQAKLRSSEMRFKAILANSLNAIFMKDGEGRYVIANAALGRFLNRPVEELIGKTDFDLFPRATAESLQNNDRRVQETKRSHQIEEEVHAGPRRLTFLSNKFPVVDQEGRVQFLGGIATDITERKRSAEKATEQARLLELSQDAIVVRDEEDRIVFWSKGAEMIYGITSREAMGQVTHAILRTTFPISLSEIRRELERSKHWTGELVHTTKAGTRLTVLSRWALEISETGARRILETNSDITQLKLAQRAVQESETRYRLLADTVSQLMWTLDSKGHTNYFNRQWELYSGRDKVWLEQHWQTLIHPFDREAHLANRYRAVHAGVGYDSEIRLKSETGEYRWHMSRVVPLKGNSGEILAWYGSAVDVENQRRAADALRCAKDDLEREVRARTAELRAANQELESFSYSVSHDLRAPLRSINGFSKRLSRKAEGLDLDSKQDLDRIQAASVRMGRLIDDLLQLSKVSRAEVHFERVDLSLQNLIGNAWKFTRGKSDARIEIRSEQDGPNSVVSVSDNGAGFDMSYAGQLFGAFQRLHSDDEFEGTGIGLVTVRRILRKHGGDVWAEAQLGKGATFYFKIPNQQGARHEPQRETTTFS